MKKMAVLKAYAKVVEVGKAGPAQKAGAAESI